MKAVRIELKDANAFVGLHLRLYGMVPKVLAIYRHKWYPYNVNRWNWRGSDPHLSLVTGVVLPIKLQSLTGLSLRGALYFLSRA